MQNLRIKIMAVLLLFGLFIGNMAAQAEVPARTLAILRLRIGPGGENALIATLPYNTQVLIEARNPIGNWLLIRTTDGTVRGWAASRFIGWDEEIELSTFPVSFELLGGAPDLPVVTNPETTAPTVPEIEGEVGSVLARLNVRSAPDTTAPVITRFEYRTKVFILARNNIGNWLLVTNEDGSVRGWVASRFISWDEEVELATFPVSEEGIENIPPSAATAAPSTNPSSAIVAPSGTTVGKSLVQRLNLRSGAGSTFPSLGQINLNATVFIEARSPRGDWLLVRAVDGSVRGWAASRFISWDEEIPLASFGVSLEEIGQ